MYNVLVILQVNNFEALDEFESQAANIMTEYGGRIERAFETCRNDDGTGEEVHLLAFENQQAFENYKSDSRHLDLRDLRDKAISGTEVKTAVRTKEYAG
jgi:uncharacterized protein (DUF1330 family)